MNNSKCRHYESKRAVPKNNLDGTFTIEKIGRCNKVHMDGCKCNGYMQACDYYSDLRARHMADEDAKPLLDGVNVYIRYLPAGGYTIGWRKLIYGEDCGVVGKYDADHPIDQAIDEFIKRMPEEIKRIYEAFRKGDKSNAFRRSNQDA